MLGPGKADLLELIAETGSIAAAGRRLGMSYKRAWSLVETLNAMFRDPLVESSRGGATFGGARLTENGRIIAMHQGDGFGTQERLFGDQFGQQTRSLKGLARTVPLT